MQPPPESPAPDGAAPQKKPLGWKLVRNLRRAFRAPIAGHRVVEDALRGRAGVEIGGPTKLFRRDLPVYRVVAELDGVNFASRTVWEGELAEGRTYRWGRRGVGHQYIADATDLARIAGARYDFVLSSNNLEHIANPIKALHEWVRVLKPGGHLLLVLPRRESNFDHRRDVTPFEHLLDDHRRGTTEADLTHLDEIVARHDYAMTPDTPTPVVLRHVGLEPVWATSTATDHLSLARKPASAAPGSDRVARPAKAVDAPGLR